jgi:hypothetical protein
MQRNLDHGKKGEKMFDQVDRVNSELLSLTYGALVIQLITDYQDVKVVNSELEQMGFNIGVRLIDEFLSRSELKSCSNFRQTASAIANIGFKMFLGITAEVRRYKDEPNPQFVLAFRGNPLNEFVEIPPQYADLQVRYI